MSWSDLHVQVLLYHSSPPSSETYSDSLDQHITKTTRYTLNTYTYNNVPICVINDIVGAEGLERYRIS